MAELNITGLERDFPSITDFYQNVNAFIIFSIATGGFLLLLNKVIFLSTLCMIFKGVRPLFRTRTILLCGIYPFIALLAFITILIPQSGLLCNSLMHISFTICAYQFYNLFVSYVGGEENFVKEADPDAFNIRTPPCCCCCLCCKMMSVTKNRMHTIRYMILQLPCIQTFIVVAINVIYFVEYDIYKNVTLYLSPFMVVSILTGLWGLNIITRMLIPYAKNHNLMLKYLCIQLVLVFCKLLPAILDIALEYINFPTEYPITKAVYKQDIVQLLILLVMASLSLLAQKAYSRPVNL